MLSKWSRKRKLHRKPRHCANIACLTLLRQAQDERGCAARLSKPVMSYRTQLACLAASTGSGPGSVRAERAQERLCGQVKEAHAPPSPDGPQRHDDPALLGPHRRAEATVTPAHAQDPRSVASPTVCREGGSAHGTRGAGASSPGQGSMQSGPLRLLGENCTRKLHKPGRSRRSAPACRPRSPPSTSSALLERPCWPCWPCWPGDRAAERALSRAHAGAHASLPSLHLLSLRAKSSMC
jgi:hypothetical protein